MNNKDNEKLIKDTRDLERMLEDTDSISQLEKYLTDNMIPEFDNVGEYFEYLLAEKKLDKSAVIRDSDIQRNYAYQIFSGTRKVPGRDKVILLCIAMKLNLEETARALSIAKVGRLYAKDSRDSVIIYAIKKGMNVIETNDLLFEFGVNLLE